MTKHTYPLILVLSILIFSNFRTHAQNIGKTELIKDCKLHVDSTKKYNWELFDIASSISADSISTEIINGNWKAYYGLYKFGSITNTMILTKPFLIEFKEDKIRRDIKSKFKKFDIQKNVITEQGDDDTLIINKITETLLVLTLKDGENYTRYYYER